MAKRVLYGQDIEFECLCTIKMFIVMTNANNIFLIKNHEIYLIEFAPFLEVIMVAVHDNFEILELICSIISYKCGSNE